MKSMERIYSGILNTSQKFIVSVYGWQNGLMPVVDFFKFYV